MTRINNQRDNCLNLIRILAAFQVMLGHMIEHFELPGSANILHMTYFFRGVPIFFVISGFLMWYSIGRSRSYGDYLIKRFWRIYPELWVAVIIEIIVLVVLYHNWNLKQLVMFVFGQGTIFQFWTPDSLRGYGVGTPNGALWTIGVMIQYYIVAWFFYKLFAHRKIGFWIIGLAISFIVSWLGGLITQNLISMTVVGKLYDQTIIKYFWLFFFGMLLAKFSDLFLPVLKKLWYICVLLAFILFLTKWDLFSGYYFGWSCLLTAGVIGFAYKYPKLQLSTDISYGMFLYHMIIVNVFVTFNWVGNWLFIIPVTIITTIIALISTVTVGKISQKRKEARNKPAMI